ncbi:hypothetical protein ABKV19_017511 [Rosa sericea]
MMEKRSLFIAVNYFGGPVFGRVFEIKLDELDHRQKGGKDEPLITPTFKYAAQLYQGGEELRQPILWKFCSLATATSTELCVLPDSGPEDFMMDDPLKGYILNISTREKPKKMKPPNAPKLFGHVLSLNGNIYFIADPYWIREAPDPSFERYDRTKRSWESLAPLPFIKEMSCNAEMVGYAVFDDFILFNISDPTYSPQLWAYDVSRNKWYLVSVENFDCYGLRGLAVVLDYTVYACTLSRSVLALSITRKQIDGGDLEFTCSLQSVFTLPYTEVLPLDGDRGRDHLVHLGNREFCLVQSGVCYGYVDYQPIRLSIFRLLLGENLVKITYTIDYEVPLQDFEPFHVRLCFSLPGCEDIVSEQEDDSDIDFILYPAVKSAPEEENLTQSEEEEETMVDLENSTPAQVDANAFVKSYYDSLLCTPELIYKSYQDSNAPCCINGNTTTEDAIKSLGEWHTCKIESVDALETSENGVSVLVTGYLVGNDNVGRKFAQTFFLAPQENSYSTYHFRFIKDNESSQTNITDEQGLEKKFKKFKWDGIQVRRNDEPGNSSGLEESESVISMQHAFEASTITTGDSKAVIEKKRKSPT